MTAKNIEHILHTCTSDESNPWIAAMKTSETEQDKRYERTKRKKKKKIGRLPENRHNTIE